MKKSNRKIACGKTLGHSGHPFGKKRSGYNFNRTNSQSTFSGSGERVFLPVKKRIETLNPEFTPASIWVFEGGGGQFSRAGKNPKKNQQKKTKGTVSGFFLAEISSYLLAGLCGTADNQWHINTSIIIGIKNRPNFSPQIHHPKTQEKKNKRYVPPVR